MSRNGDRPRPTDQLAEHDHLRPVNDPRRQCLEDLAAAIEQESDLRARVVPPSRSGTGTIILHVVNPHARDLSEDIGCDLLDGDWWFTWPLNDSSTLGPADDIDAAVELINRVLMVKM